MADLPKVILRYFNCRGRAQPLRLALVDAGTAFTDEIVPLSRDWFQHKANPEFAGPFGTLPVLHWGDFRLAQTLPIASYLSYRLGHNEGRSAEEIAALEMVTSALYLDFRHPIGEMRWQRGAPEDADAWSAWLDAYVTRFHAGLPAFERLLVTSKGNGGWFGGDRPVIADYFAFETIFEWQEILGPSLHGTLEACPCLSDLMHKMNDRPRIRLHFESKTRPIPYSGSPRDVETLERMRTDLKRRGLAA